MFATFAFAGALIAGTAGGLIWATYSAKTRKKVEKVVAKLLRRAVDEATKQ